jgi:hypothetical protein
LCTAHPMYGTSRLWTAYIGAHRASRLGGGTTSWTTWPRKATLAELRMARGLSQAAVGAQLGMNQSEVSRLERRRDMRLSTLRSYVEAIGGQLRMMATWPDRLRQYELVVGDSSLEPPGSGSRTREGAARRSR